MGNEIAPLKSLSVKIGFSTDDGYRSDSAYTSKRAGTPGACMAYVADEIGRLSEMFGFGDEVESAVKAARQRVIDWRKEQDQQP